MRHRIVYTRPDGGVSICCPSANALRYMATGGRWADRPKGYVDVQIERQVAAGHQEHAAVAFCRAMAFGGLTEPEALAVIRDRDCGHLGTGHELWDVSDLPADRWFRNAWRRSSNGGPIDIDIKAARGIQWAKAREAVRVENRRREHAFADPVEPDWAAIRQLIQRSETPDELRRIWPLGERT